MKRSIHQIEGACHRIPVHQDTLECRVQFGRIEYRLSVVTLTIHTRDLPAQSGRNSELVGSLPRVRYEVALIVELGVGKQRSLNQAAVVG
jgi:hypothetical protein